MEKQMKKKYGSINSDQILEAKKGLETLEVEKTYTVSKAVYELRTEIIKLVRKGVKISQIITELKKHKIGATRIEIREILGDLAPKRGKKEVNENKIVENKEVKETKKEEKKEDIKQIVGKKVETPVQKAVVVPAQAEEKKPGFKVPDLSTLPPELTSIPGFDPTSSEIVHFVNERGRKKIYMKGRVVDDPNQQSGPMHSIDLDKHR